jgi:glycerol-3-phosphate dehydrogenase
VAAEYGLSVETVEFLLRRHGSHVGEVLSLGAGDRALFEPLDPGAPYLRAEVIHGVTHEGARTIEDVLLRRMRIGMEIRNRAESVVNPVADLMASALGWDADERAAAVVDYSVPISN